MPAFGVPLSAIFGARPGWLLNAVPGGTEFDFVNGKMNGPLGPFARTGEKCWIPTGMTTTYMFLKGLS